MRTTHQPSPSLVDALEEWVEAGLLTPEQSRAIREHEAEQRRPHAAAAVRRPAEAGPTLVVEALGYLGGVVMLVGAGLLAGMFWPDLSVPLRLALVGATALALIGGGFAVPDRLGEAAGRLRSVLWALGIGATAGFFSIFSTEVLDRYDEHALVIVGPLTAVVAGALWWLRHTWLQQLALLAPLLVSAVGVGMELTSTDSSWGGALVWATALCWAALSWAGRLEPRATGVAFGVLGAVMGGLTMSSEVGVALALATAVAAAVLALWERSLPWLGVAAITLLWTMPRAAEAWFPGRLSAALTLLAPAAPWWGRRSGSPGTGARSRRDVVRPATAEVRRRRRPWLVPCGTVPPWQTARPTTVPRSRCPRCPCGAGGMHPTCLRRRRSRVGDAAGGTSRRCR